MIKISIKINKDKHISKEWIENYNNSNKCKELTKLCQLVLEKID